MSDKKEVVVYNGKPIAIVTGRPQGLVTFRYLTNGKEVIVTSHILNVKIIENEKMYDEYYQKNFGDITRKEIENATTPLL